jgi:drug/metabolite transporter (DMT)-like permease
MAAGAGPAAAGTGSSALYNKMSNTLSRRDAFLLCMLTLIWGINWPIMKVGVADFPAFTFRWVTMAGGLVVFALVARVQGHSLRVARLHWAELAKLSITNMAVWYALSIIAIDLLASGRAAILGYTLPVWVALIGLLVYGERQGARLALGLAAAAIGVGLLLANELQAIAGSPVGTGCMLAAAAVWALGTHQLRRRLQPTPLVVLSFWMMTGAMAVCALLSLIFERHRWVRWPNAAEWGAIAFNILLAYGVAQLLWFRLASALPPVVSALSVMMIPVVGVLSGLLLLGEQPGWTDLVALVAILVAIGATLIPAKQAKQRGT